MSTALAASQGGGSDSSGSAPLPRSGVPGMHPFHVRRELARRGWPPLPILRHDDHRPKKKGGKAPVIFGWQDYARFDAEPADTATLKEWTAKFDHAPGTGIACGRVIGIDIDCLDAALAAEVRRLAEQEFGVTPFVRVGRAPKLLLVYQAAEPVPKRRFVAEASDNALEILGEGSQFVAFGIHPVTCQPYEWIGEKSPLTGDPDDAPIISASQIERFIDAVRGIMPLKQSGGRHGGDDSFNVVEFSGSRSAVDSFFSRLKDKARANYDAWVPELGLSRICREPGGYAAVPEWRASSTGRPLAQRNLNLHFDARGIVDWGDGPRHYSPLDVVMSALGLDFDGAVQWLGERVDPRWNDPPIILTSSGARTMPSTSSDLVPLAVDDAAARHHANDNTEAAAPAVPATATPATKRVNLRVIGDRAIEPQRWLVKGVLPETGVALLAGQYAAGKTFVGIDVALSICCDEPFFGRNVATGGVLWIAAEGAGEIETRVRAASTAKYRLDPDERMPFLWCEDVPSMSPNAFAVWLGNAIAEARKDCDEEFGVPLRLVVVDTLAAAFGIVDENDNAEAAGIMRKVADLGRRLGVLIMPIAHLGKAAESGVRGASAYGAGADAILGLTTTSDPLSGHVSSRAMALLKSRRGPTGPLSGFKLVTHEVGRDADGDPVESCYVAADLAPTTRSGDKITHTARTFIDAFNEVVGTGGFDHRVHDDGPKVRAVPVVLVREEFERRHTTGETDPKKAGAARRQAWRRALEAVTIKLGLFASENLGLERGEAIWRRQEIGLR